MPSKTPTDPPLYATQGIVQVIQGKGQFSVVISPSPDYLVKHKENGDKEMEYIIFISASDPRPYAYERTELFTAEAVLKAALMQAAVQGTKVELRVMDGKKTIVAVKIPATPRP